MKQQTHQNIDSVLSGKPIAIKDGESEVLLVTTEHMIADESGLVHGGFIFSLADYAAMLAVNHPHVVLAGAQVNFLRPVINGQEVVAHGKIIEQDERKYLVSVKAYVGKDEVFKGKFNCVVLKQHVLDRN